MTRFDLTLDSEPDGARRAIFSSLMAISYFATSVAVTQTPFVITKSKSSIVKGLVKTSNCAPCRDLTSFTTSVTKSVAVAVLDGLPSVI
jgi:hypothetical protein